MLSRRSSSRLLLLPSCVERLSVLAFPNADAPRPPLPDRKARLSRPCSKDPSALLEVSRDRDGLVASLPFSSTCGLCLLPLRCRWTSGSDVTGATANSVIERTPERACASGADDVEAIHGLTLLLPPCHSIQLAWVNAFVGGKGPSSSRTSLSPYGLFDMSQTVVDVEHKQLGRP